MAVYDGVPSIRLEGDEKRALALIPEAKALLYKVQNILAKTGTSTYSMSRRVSDDAYIYVLCTGGQNIITISVAPTTVDTVLPEVPGHLTRLFPDFYSGLVYDGRMGERTRTVDGETIRFAICESFSPTMICQQVTGLSPGRQPVGRLAVRPSGELPELENDGGGAQYTQYQRLRPSMYSGTMKQVVQVLMGMGRIGAAKLRDPESSAPDTSYIGQVDANGVQIQYDYKFNRTHGITRAVDGRLWLVEISISRGVLAMPLPIFPASDTAGFRARAEARGDDAMVLAIDELGCLPTGESFPSALSTAIANGDVLRLLEPSELSPFYAHSSYSSSLGWAFSKRGVEAHNTAWYFSDNDGIQRGVWYQIGLHISALTPDREPGEPIAPALAYIRRQNEGIIYCPPFPKTSWARYVPIKFHEPLLPGLKSHDGAPAYGSTGVAGPHCDTVMFVCFVDDDLKAVRYYRNPRVANNSGTEDDRFSGECIYGGSWDIVTRSGGGYIPSMMYSNDFDDRRTLQGSITTTNITSDDLGYDPPRFSDFITNPQVSHVFRHRVFRRTTTTEVQDGDSVSSVVAVPQYSREAYYYATGSYFTGGRSGSVGVAYDLLKDPNVGYSWRAFPSGYASFPWPDGIGCDPDRCGGIWTPDGSKPHSERKIVCLDFQPYDCSEYADAGTWLSMCETVDSFNQLGMDKTATYTAWNLGEDPRAVLKLISPGHGGPLEIPLTFSAFANKWMAPSPDPMSFIIQRIYATHSAIGDDLLVYYDNLSVAGPNVRVFGSSPDTITNADGFPCIIGVNTP